jgi:transketolase
VIAKTVPGKGVREFENNYKWHGVPPNEEQGKRALLELEEERKKIEAGKEEAAKNLTGEKGATQGQKENKAQKTGAGKGKENFAGKGKKGN